MNIFPAHGADPHPVQGRGNGTFGGFPSVAIVRHLILSGEGGFQGTPLLGRLKFSGQVDQLDTFGPGQVFATLGFGIQIGVAGGFRGVQPFGGCALPRAGRAA